MDRTTNGSSSWRKADKASTCENISRPQTENVKWDVVRCGTMETSFKPHTYSTRLCRPSAYRFIFSVFPLPSLFSVISSDFSLLWTWLPLIHSSLPCPFLKLFPPFFVSQHRKPCGALGSSEAVWSSLLFLVLAPMALHACRPACLSSDWTYSHLGPKNAKITIFLPLICSLLHHSLYSFCLVTTHMWNVSHGVFSWPMSPWPQEHIWSLLSMWRAVARGID